MAERPFTQSDLDILAQWDTPTICNGLEITSPERRAFGYTVTDAVTTAPRTPTRGQARLLAFTAGAVPHHGHLHDHHVHRRRARLLGRRARLRTVGVGGRLRSGGRVSRPRVAVLASRGSPRAPSCRGVWGAAPPHNY